MEEAKMAANPSSLKTGDKFLLQTDDTFTVSHSGATLQFKFHNDPRSVELISISEPVAPGKPPPVGIDWKASDLLDHLSRSNAAFICPLDITNIADLTNSLRYFKEISEGVEVGGATKPRVLLRSDALAGLGSRASFDKAVRTALGRSRTFDARIVEYTKARKK
jgi:hypothetical protein